MGIQYEGDSSEEILRITRENNRMLKAMRRSSLIGAIFKTVLWIALIVIPLWFYIEYIAPVMTSMMATYEQMQGTSAAAQAHMGQFSESMERLQGLFGGGE